MSAAKESPGQLRGVNKYANGSPEHKAYLDGWCAGIEHALSDRARDARRAVAAARAAATRRKRKAIAKGLVVDLEAVRARRARRKVGATINR